MLRKRALVSLLAAAAVVLGGVLIAGIAGAAPQTTAGARDNGPSADFSNGIRQLDQRSTQERLPLSLPRSMPNGREL